ncbi:hypothetical protein HK096_005994 [Nowakowskiella sp. JEL0078]|nr:hypothetical protein HK096_005994 [Nowakowskiella sp. JEL0078]
MAKDKGVDKVLNKLAASVALGNYYEAHQMYHSVCQRMHLIVTQRYLKQNKISDALDLLQSGVKNLLKYSQVGSASDLCQRLLDIFVDKEIKVTDDSLARIIDIFQDYPVSDPSCKDFVRNALRWSTKFSQYPSGDPSLHHVFGLKFYKDCDFYEAEAHFALGNVDSARAAGHLAWEWGSEKHVEDPGYFVARIVCLSEKDSMRFYGFRDIH